VLRPLVSPGLELDVFEGLGFVTVAMVWTRDLRPAGFPAFLGQDFFLAGYRIFTRLRDETGRGRRGLQILRSETDKSRMVRLGNLMTQYYYRRVDLRITENGAETHVQSALADGTPALDITFELPEGPVGLPAGSPCPDWRAARRFAGPMPFTFSRVADGSFVVIEGRREDWEPRPILVKHWQVGFFAETALGTAKPVLANAFIVKDIAYRWERGKIVKPESAS
jgi:hypothetical protein